MEELKAKTIKGPNGLRKEAKKYGILNYTYMNKEQLINDILIKQGLLNEQPSKPVYERKRDFNVKYRDSAFVKENSFRSAFNDSMRDIRIQGKEGTYVFTFLQDSKERIMVLNGFEKPIKFSFTISCNYYKTIQDGSKDDTYYHRALVTTLTDESNIRDLVKDQIIQLNVKDQGF